MGTADDAIAVSKIFINTNLAACGGVMAAALVTRLMIGKDRCNTDVKWCDRWFSCNNC